MVLFYFHKAKVDQRGKEVDESTLHDRRGLAVMHPGSIMEGHGGTTTEAIVD